ncbi:uncharacterized protein LOC132199745 [Neocloeon triangulifer]|uniref:uncharacterized protein LOC132199745 n=1 Tax=Neocloeon triangulifer TaxID=2078957 RepID=UPI00286F4462|nr:uncharacterized protein LOC132199745 [Neocloeon triangulifer]
MAAVPDARKYETPLSKSFSPSFANSVDILNSSEIAEITAMPEEGVAAALKHCKLRVVVPYFRLLAAVGLRPLTLTNSCPCWLVTSLSFLHLGLVLILLVLGYGLQFLSCFRRDLGPLGQINGNDVQQWEEKCPLTQLVSNFVVPSILHLITYLYVLYLFRIKDIEQLPNLMERVFVVSCPPGGVVQPKKVTRSLWLLLAMASVWLVMSVVTFSLALILNPPNFRWIYMDPIFIRALLATGTMVQDAVQSTLVSGYCLQAHLLTLLAAALKQRVLKHTLSLLDWMREVRELLELLRHLNDRLAPAVCVLALISASWALSGLITIVRKPESTRVYLAVLLIILWATLAIAPFIMATRLSRHCDALREVGHEIRARPFEYMDASSEDLNSLLLFASTLRLKPSLFGTPVSGRSMCILLSLVALTALVAGQIA